MNLHLERRLEVLAREIAASKTPKIDAAANALFEQIGKKHEHKAPSDWVPKINGAAQVLRSESVQAAPASVEKANLTAANSANGHAVVTPEAAPPSAQNFKVGDRVQWTTEVMRDCHFMPDQNKPWTIARIEGMKAYDHDGTYELFGNIELIPATEPAATPVALGDGWVQCSPDMPDIPAGRYELRSKKHPEYVMRPNGEWSLRLNVRTPEAIAAHQYRKVIA